MGSFRARANWFLWGAVLVHLSCNSLETSNAEETATNETDSSTEREENHGTTTEGDSESPSVGSADSADSKDSGEEDGGDTTDFPGRDSESDSQSPEDEPGNICGPVEPGEEPTTEIIPPDGKGPCGKGGSERIDPVSPPLFVGRVTGIYAASQGVAVAVTHAGELLTYDGTIWRSRSYSSWRFVALSGFSCDHVYIVARGDGGIYHLLRFDGQHLRRILATDEVFKDVEAVNESTVFLLSSWNELHRYNGLEIHRLNKGWVLDLPTAQLPHQCFEESFDLHATSEDDIWFSLSGSCEEKGSIFPVYLGELLRSDGGKWWKEKKFSGIGSPAVGSNGPEDILLVGAQGWAHHYDGHDFRRIGEIPGEGTKVEGDGQGGFWIGNPLGLVHLSQAGVRPVESCGARTVDLAPVDEDSVFTATAGGTVRLWDGQTCHRANKHSIRGIVDFWMSPDRVAYAVTKYGALWKLEDGAATRLAKTDGVILDSVTGAPDGAIYVGGHKPLLPPKKKRPFVAEFEDGGLTEIDLGSPSWPFDRGGALAEAHGFWGIHVAAGLSQDPDAAVPLANVDDRGEWRANGATAGGPKNVSSLDAPIAGRFVAAAQGKAWVYREGWSVLDSSGVAVEKVCWESPHESIHAVGQGRLLRGWDSLTPVETCLGDWGAVDLACPDKDDIWLAVQRPAKNGAVELGVLHMVEGECELLWSAVGESLSLSAIDVVGEDFVAVGRDGEHGLIAASMDSIPKRLHSDEPVSPLKDVEWETPDSFVAVGQNGTVLRYGEEGFVDGTNALYGDLVHLALRTKIFATNRKNELFRGDLHDLRVSSPGRYCNSVEDIAYDEASGALHVICDTGTALTLRDGALVEAAALSPFGLSVVEAHPGGAVAGGTGWSAWRWSSKGWRPAPITWNSSWRAEPDTVLAIAAHGDDNIWATFEDVGLMRYKDGSWDHSFNRRRWDLLAAVPGGRALGLRSLVGDEIGLVGDGVYLDEPIPQSEYKALFAFDESDFYLVDANDSVQHFPCWRFED